jgi:hypothetical protein
VSTYVMSQYLQPLVLGAICGGGASQTSWTGGATWYWGVSTQTAVGATDATLLSGEPTSGTGGYGRVTYTNNSTNFPTPSGSNPSTSKAHVAWNFTASSGAWSTGSSALTTVFLADGNTPGAGHVILYAPLSPATDTVNGSGVTLSFAADAVQFTAG